MAQAATKWEGISYIEHLDFEVFNEGIRLKETIYKTQLLTHAKVRILGAGGIYANNANRNYVTQQKIKTDFKRKGNATANKKHRSQLCQVITKERVSRLEGSFGTRKEYFLLNRIKARTQLNERLWIFFGIHTSSAIKIGRRMSQGSAIAA